MHMRDTIRWVLIVPAAVLGFYAAILLGMLSYFMAESFCPEEAMVSGMCTAPYMRVFEKVAFVAFPTLASLIIIWSVYFLAPRYKVYVSSAAYLVGASIAMYFGWATKQWLTLGAVLVFAGFSLWIQSRITEAAD